MNIRHLCIALLFVLANTFSLSSIAQQKLKVVTYNTHGGHGNLALNLQRFKELLEGDEQVLCVQEVGPGIWEQVKAAFPEYPYTYEVWQKTTDQLMPWEVEPLWAGGGILSKLPIVSRNSRLIQVDPGGDLWERRAAFVRVQTGPTPNDNVFLAHYHNTYNWDKNDYESEQAGMVKFRQIALEEMGQSSLNTSAPYVLAGDFNIMEDKVRKILYDAPHYVGVWRDHMVSNIPMSATRFIDTNGLNISDHNAVVATYNHSINNKPTPVKLSEHCDYSGNTVGLPVGNYTLAQLQAAGIKNDDISSIQIESGYKVEVFQHHDFTGNALVLNHSDNCLANEGFNDDVSSIRISTTQNFSLTKQAESYSSKSGTELENTSDVGGGQNVGWINAGNWLAYSNIAIPAAGSYTIEYRVASGGNGGRLSVDLNGGTIQLGTIDIPGTGGWQTWRTVSHNVTINSPGNYSFGIYAAIGGWNINWWRITRN